MKIAIVGAGFSGLATAWHLLKQTPGPLHLVLFDSKGIGAGASGIAAGLLHPYAGAHAKLNRMGKEGMQATKELIAISSQVLNQPTAWEKGILRLALNAEQKEDFAYCANQYPEEIEWMDSEACQKLYPFLTKAPGIWIKQGLVVHSLLYLKGLWESCKNLGAELKIQHINSLEELHNFDVTVLTGGAGLTRFYELSHLKLSLVKGQVLELEWPQDLPPVPFALNSHAYLIMNDQRSCVVGATFERDYHTVGIDVERAREEIIPKIVAMIPQLQSAKILQCKAGFRVATPNHMPLLQQINKTQWILTGMGSKGLLYHALFAQTLASQIIAQYS